MTRCVNSNPTSKLGMPTSGPKAVPRMKGPIGALEAATAGLEAMVSKLRKSLKGSKAKEWQAARRACASLFRKGVPRTVGPIGICLQGTIVTHGPKRGWSLRGDLKPGFGVLGPQMGECTPP